MPAKIKIREVQDGIDGAPPWITTFVDMISLLVTFFILLFTFSAVQQNDEFTYPQNILGTAGIIESEGKNSMDAPADDVMNAMDIARGAQAPHSRPKDLLHRNLEEMGQKLSQQHLEFDANDVADGLLFRFDDSASFAPGSARVGPSLQKALVELGQVMQHYRHMIVVEGHTDSEFKPTPEYPDAQALAMARAAAAAQVLLDTSELSPLLLQVASLGDSVPVAGDGADIGGNGNETGRARRLNRRVEVRIVALSKARDKALHEEEQGR